MFIRDYLKVLLPLLAMLGTYRLIAVPFIEPTRAAQAARPSFESRPHESAWWNEHFVDDAWQRKQPKILETPQGILLFNQWEKLAPDRWKLSPLTIIIPQSASTSPASTNLGRRRATLIESPQGAEIQFREAIDWTGGKPPPVVGGQLNGKITIYSPPEPGSSEDTGMRIDAADLRIDRRKVWTTNAVTMRIGRSYIEGRDLSIFLDQDLLSSEASTSGEVDSPFKGLDHLELIYVDRVHIDLPDGGLFAGQSSPTQHMSVGKPAHAEVSCRSAFQFDFHQSMARLASKVELRHMVEGMSPDTFNCDRLDLRFNWKKPSSNVESTSNQEWTIDQIEAVGSNGIDVNDPTRWVQLEAPSINSRATSRRMRVDLDRGRISMSNRLPGQPNNDPAPVYLQRESMQLRAPELEYEGERLRQDKISEGGSSGTSLGRVWAAGPGQATVLADDGGTWRLSWAKLLELKPEGLLDRLTIDGSANAINERQGQFSAETVDIWLKSIDRPILDRVKQQSGGYEPSGILPQRIHASGTVMIRSPQLRTQVADLQAWFVYPEIELAINSLKNQSPVPLMLSNSDSVVVQPSNSRPEEKAIVASPLGTAFSNIVSMADQTSLSNAAPQSRSNNGPGHVATSSIELPNLSSPGAIRSNAVNHTPTNITGETLIAKFAQSSQGLKIVDLAVNKNVAITRDQASSTSPMPLTIVGHQLRIDSGEQENLDVTIVGNPAKFSIGAAAIESSEIHVSQARRMVWMDQPGKFKLPPEAFQQSSKKNVATTNLNGGNLFTPPGFINQQNASSESQLEWISQPEVEWQGRMIFDGLKARMDGGVRLTARVASQNDVLWHLDGHANELNVELKDAIDFAGDGGSKAEVALIRLVDDVDLKASQTDRQGIRKISREHLEVPELTFFVPEQKWLGKGPGSLRSRRIGNATPDSPAAILTGVPSSAPSTQLRNPQAELQCIHLRFGGRMEGDMAKQQVHFFDRVEVLLQPILSWDQAPDVRLVDVLKTGQTMMTCDALRLENSSSLSWNQYQIANQQLKSDAAWEITGEGHVRLDNVNEDGSMSLVTPGGIQYVALHSLLRIYGNGIEAAEVRRTTQSGPKQGPGTALISNGAFNLKTGESDIQFRSVSMDFGSDKENTRPAPAVPSNPGTGGYGIPSSNSGSAIADPRGMQQFIPTRQYP
jgi:hypothetical protein